MKLFNKKHEDHAQFYDLGMKLHWLGKYRRFRESLVAGFGDFEESAIFDFGCGTGLLLEYIKQNYNYQGIYIGGDPGFRMLAVARKKQIRHSRLLWLQIAEIPQLPVKDAGIDIFVSSLVTHQLPLESKIKLFHEAYRVLKPGGILILAEFGRPYNLQGKIGAFLLRSVWGRIIPDIASNSAENLVGRVPELIKNAGFTKVSITHNWQGLINVIRGVKSS